MSEVIINHHYGPHVRVGEILLNRPSSLNALSFKMIELIKSQIYSWNSSLEVDIIFIHSSCDRAFCAGGDVKSLLPINYGSGFTNDELKQALKYFKTEYELYLLIYNSSIPTVAWCQGYCFGGGLGLFQSTNLRIVTEDAVLSMPEISIGFFTDAGAGWFLNKLPIKLALFMGLTGHQLKGTSSVLVELSDLILPSSFKQNFLISLTNLNYNKNTPIINQLETTINPKLINLNGREKVNLNDQINLINNLIVPDSFEKTLTNLFQYLDNGLNNELKTSILRLKNGSLFSAKIIWKHLIDCQNLTLREVLEKDLQVAKNILMYGEFIEGVHSKFKRKEKANWKMCFD